MKIYIAGKITGRDNYKEEFKKVQEMLESQGHAVMNPSVMLKGFEEPEYHHVCMAMIDVCEVLYFLPTWVDSKGAHLEMGYAYGKGKRIIIHRENEIGALIDCMAEL